MSDVVHAVFIDCEPNEKDFVVLRKKSKEEIQMFLEEVFKTQDLIIVCNKTYLFPMIQEIALKNQRSVKIITDIVNYKDSFKNAELCLQYDQSYDFQNECFYNI